MPADQLRNRTVGCKMTESECERLIAVRKRSLRTRTTYRLGDFQEATMDYQVWRRRI
jgi:hypothetical protein